MRYDPSGSPAFRGQANEGRCVSDSELLKLWEDRLRSLLGDDAASAVELQYSNGRLFLCPEAGSDSLDRCMPRLLANCPDWDMVVLLPPGSDPHSLRAALERDQGHHSLRDGG